MYFKNLVYLSAKFSEIMSELHLTDGLRTGLPAGRRHGHFPQIRQFKKIHGRGRIVAVRGRKVSVMVPKMIKSGCIKLFLKIPIM
jgi:hypothetical protein